MAVGSVSQDAASTIWESKDFIIALVGFSGAVVGGLLGVIGALIVARNDFNAKVRSAAIAISVDMEKIISITVHHNKSGNDSLVVGDYLRDHPVQISPLFSQHCVTLFSAKLDYLEIQALVQHLAAFELNFDELNRSIQFHKTAISGPPKPRTDLVEDNLRKAAYNAVCVNYILTKNKLVRQKGFERNPAVEEQYRREFNDRLAP